MSIEDYDAGVKVGIELMRAAVIVRLEQGAKDWQNAAREYVDDLRPCDTMYDRNVYRAETCNIYVDAVRRLEVPDPPTPEAPRIRTLTCADRIPMPGDVIRDKDAPDWVEPWEVGVASRIFHTERHIYVSRADGGPIQTTTEAAEGEAGC